MLAYGWVSTAIQVRKGIRPPSSIGVQAPGRYSFGWPLHYRVFAGMQDLRGKLRADLLTVLSARLSNFVIATSWWLFSFLPCRLVSFPFLVNYIKWLKVLKTPPYQRQRTRKTAAYHPSVSPVLALQDNARLWPGVWLIQYSR